MSCNSGDAPPDKSPKDSQAPPAEEVSSLPEPRPDDETRDFAGYADMQPIAAPGTSTCAAYGRYVVKAALGSGAFGTVYLGHDPLLDRAVAIKTHRADRVAAPALAAFQDEARRLARLRHPGIVAVHDFGVHDDQVYIVADFVQGITLRHALRQRRFPWQESVTIVAALAEALAHAHAQRTVHRDVKPANIILTPDGPPILVDFGLGLDDAQAAGDQRGLVIGTAAYMSPEQTAGLGHRVDGRTDIYALGVVFYEMLTGRTPFQAQSTAELMRQVCEDEPQPPRQLVPQLPRGLEQACLKALAKHPGDRFTTAGDFAEALQSLVRAESVSTPTVPSGADRTATTAAPPAPPASDSSSAATSSARRREAREAERRQVTLLICRCDLCEAAEFLENLDFEDQLAVKTRYQETVASVIAQNGGTIIQMTDPEILACFGFPVAHEDAADRAVRGGRALLRDLAALRESLQQHGIRFVVSVQVHTGMAVVAATADGSAREAISVAGEVHNVITRLDPVARPDTVVISQATYRLVHGTFVCEALATATIKGTARPIEFFRVLDEKPVQSRIDNAADAGLTPLVGRDREVGLLEDRWEQAVEGMGQVVLIIGEAGLGKSRLVHVIKERVTASAAGDIGLIVEWRCAPQHQDSSLFPVIDFFTRHLRFARAESPESRFDRLQEHVASLGLDGNAVVHLAALLSLPLASGAAPLSPARQKELTLETILAWLHAAAVRQPFLFVVEDLHWIDPSTLELLARHIESGPSDRILTLMTFRPEFETPWKSKAHQTVMALNRLTRKQIAGMIQQKTGVQALPPALIEQMAAKTDGIPLFVEEYTRMIIEADQLKNDGGDVSMTSSIIAQQIPATLHDLLLARLDRMASNRAVAQIAAVLGREFSYELLRAVAPLEEADLQGELVKLVQAEMLYAKGKPPSCTYQFKHALIQDAAYQSLVKSKRQQVHRRVAVALEQFSEIARNQPELLAHHFTEAGLVLPAIDYWTRAGRRSMERSANAEAANQVRRGLELVATLPDNAERAGRELEMQIALGTALIATRGYAAPEVGPIFDRAHALCRQIGDPAALTAVLWGIWAWRVVREELDWCLELAEEMLQLADAQADDGIRMEAHFVPGLTLFYRGEFAAARDHLQSAIALYDAERCRQWSRQTGQNAGVTARSYLALAQWHLGYPDQARRTAEEAVALACAMGHPFSQCYAHHHRGWLEQYLRLGEAAQASTAANLAIAVEQGFVFWKATGTLCRAAALLLQEQPVRALAEAEQGLAYFRATGAALSIAHYLGYIAEAHRRLGQLDRALPTVDDAIAATRTNRNEFFLAELLRMKGEILLAQSPANHATAAACFQDSLAVAARQQALSWELRTTMSLYRLRQTQGRAAEARGRLAAIYDRFTEGFATADLLDARRWLDGN